jgi:tRNA(fMet)-specific endonuclease VapC
VTYLLDTDHITILQRETGHAYATLRARLAQHPPEELAFSIISLHEQVIGCHTYINQAQTAADLVRGYAMLATVLRTFSRALVLPFDDAAAAVSARLVAQRVRLRRMDLRIAAMALARGLVVVTRNTQDFGRVPGLQIEDWTVEGQLP